MTIIVQAVELLNSITSDWVDNIYPNAIPEEAQEKTDETIILVRPAFDTLGDYSSDTFNTITRHLSIQIFYKLGNEIDYDLKEVQLYKALEAKGFRVDDIKGRLTDIDTGQDYQTFTVTNNKTV